MLKLISTGQKDSNGNSSELRIARDAKQLELSYIPDRNRYYNDVLIRGLINLKWESCILNIVLDISANDQLVPLLCENSVGRCMQWIKVALLIPAS